MHATEIITQTIGNTPTGYTNPASYGAGFPQIRSAKSFQAKPLEQCNYALLGLAFEGAWLSSQDAFHASVELFVLDHQVVDRKDAINLMVGVNGVEAPVHAQPHVQQRPRHDGEQVGLALHGVYERCLQSRLAAFIVVSVYRLRPAAGTVTKADHLDLFATDIPFSFDTNEADGAVAKTLVHDNCIGIHLPGAVVCRLRSAASQYR